MIDLTDNGVFVTSPYVAGPHGEGFEVLFKNSCEDLPVLSLGGFHEINVSWYSNDPTDVQYGFNSLETYRLTPDEVNEVLATFKRIAKRHFTKVKKA